MGWKQWINRDSAGRKHAASLFGAVAIAMVGATAALPASAQTVPTTGIAITKHNLGTTGVSGNNQFSGTAEICVFCHTPHGADTTAAVPLWNRTLAGQTYQTYDSLGTTTLDGKVVAVGSVSIACLSCHDGAQAMNAVINAPGSGLTGDATWTAGKWSGPNVDTASGKITGVALLGTDLRNDHPIGIQYGGGGYTTANKTGIAGSPSGGKDPDFKTLQNGTMNNTTVWWVDTDATTGRQKQDMIMYTRNATGGTQTATDAEPFVECASCHDPHVSANPTFLRISNAGSAVCLACHIK